MRKNLYISSALITCLFFLNVSAFSKEENKNLLPYEKVAVEISSAAASANMKKIAVLTFSMADSTSSVKEGAVIAERITTQLIKVGSLEIIERSQLEKVLHELKMENSGLVSPSDAKSVGKILGADAIVTGTLVKMKDGKVEINARLISTQDARAVAAFYLKVEKDWQINDLDNSPKSTNDRRYLRQRLMQK